MGWFNFFSSFSFDGELFLFFFSSELFLLRSDGFNISGNEQINHDVPWLIGWELSSEDHDFSGQHPENGGNSLGDSVVAWDDNIDEIQWGIGVAQSDGWDVNV